MIKRIVAGIAGALWTSLAFAQFPPGIGPLVPNSSGGSSGVTAGTTTCTSCNANGLLYSDGTSVQSLATANNGVLVTSAGGVPSIQSIANCNTSLSALTWTTGGTGFGCNTFAQSAGLTANTFTGVQTLPAGLVGAPSITWGDSTTGWYRPGANKLALAISGVEKFDCNDTQTNDCTIHGNLFLVGGRYQSDSTTGAYYSSSTASRPVLLINTSGGAGNYGVVGTDGVDTFQLGYSASGSLGTAVIKWTDNAAVTINPPSGVVMLGSGSALTGSTGEVGLPKIAASGSAPGAAGGKFELVCGTGAGSAKLIAYAGTSTTPVTIVDNIGSGVTGC